MYAQLPFALTDLKTVKPKENCSEKNTFTPPLQLSFATSFAATLQMRAKTRDLRVMCQSFLSDFNQNRNGSETFHKIH
jgi:hypothetical protein